MAKILEVKYENQADAHICEVAHESQADLCWHEVHYATQASGDAIWFFVAYANQASFKVLRVKHASLADLKIFKVATPEGDREVYAVDYFHDLDTIFARTDALVLTGHNRREIAYLLHLPETALMVDWARDIPREAIAPIKEIFARVENAGPSKRIPPRHFNAQIQAYTDARLAQMAGDGQLAQALYRQAEQSDPKSSYGLASAKFVDRLSHAKQN